MTINELILFGLQQLTDSTTPRIDVEALLIRVLNCSPIFLRTYPEQKVPEHLVDEFNNMLIRRVAGEPIAYILQEKHFWTFSVKVSKDVLIPRSETELLVEKTLEKIPTADKKKNINLLDLGTGSGVIAIALALELPDALVFALDTSQEALEVAKFNAKKNNANNISFLHGDWFTPFQHMKGKFSCIVSNPPYIASNDPHLNNKELKFEPTQALIAGKTGLDDLITIIVNSQDYLTHNGWLLVEHGYDQANNIIELFQNNSYGDISSYKDLAGHIRVTCGRKL